MLADHVEDVGGKLYVMGGGWNHIRAFTTPVVRPEMGIAVGLSVSWNETNQPFKLEIQLEDQDGTALLPEPMGGELTVGRPPDADPGADQAIVFAVTLYSVELPRVGRYRFTLSANGETIAMAPFDVLPAGR